MRKRLGFNFRGKGTVGFTLIELMVVLTILAIAATIGLVTYTNAQKAARDAKRKQDLKAIAVGLELFYQKYNHYPISNAIPPGDSFTGIGQPNWNNWSHSSAIASWEGTIGNTLVPTYLSELPIDPINDTTNCGGNESWSVPAQECYSYDYWSGFSNGGNLPDCRQGNGQVFILTTRLEVTTDPDGIGNGSPKTSCIDDVQHITSSGFPDHEYVIVSP